MYADRRLNIAYPLAWHRPDTRACREQTVNTAAALAKLGHAVTLFAPTPLGARAASAIEVAEHFRVAPDFDVVPVESRWGGDSLIGGVAWLHQLFRSGRLDGFDMLLCRLPAMLVMGRRSPLPFAFDHYRPWPDIYPLAKSYIRETANGPGSMGLALHSTLAADSYRRAGVEPGRVIVAHNGTAQEPPDLPLSRNEARQLLGFDEVTPMVTYAGRINAQKGLDQVLQMARLMPDCRFMLVGSEGDGPIETEARALANVTVVGWQTPDRLALHLAAADVLLIPPSSEPLRRFGNCIMPLKTFSYLAAGRPILAPALPDTAELLRDGDTAVLVKPDEVALAAEALRRLLDRPDHAATLSARAFELARECTWAARAAKLSEFFLRRLSEMQNASPQPSRSIRAAMRRAAAL